MTADKKFKKRVRERMRVTGLGYTAARIEQMKADEDAKVEAAVKHMFREKRTVLPER